MTKPVLAGPITRQFRRLYMTHVQYRKFLRGQSDRPKLTALTGVPFVLVFSQEGRA